MEQSEPWYICKLRTYDRRLDLLYAEYPSKRCSMLAKLAIEASEGRMSQYHSDETAIASLTGCKHTPSQVAWTNTTIMKLHEKLATAVWKAEYESCSSPQDGPLGITAALICLALASRRKCWSRAATTRRLRPHPHTRPSRRYRPLQRRLPSPPPSRGRHSPQPLTVTLGWLNRTPPASSR